MTVDIISELKVVEVADRGVPNLERIVMRANEVVRVGEFAVLLGVRQQGDSAYPIRDNFYWFGHGIVNKGDWVFLYTGPGETRTVELPGTTEKLYVVHWGRENVILNHQEIVPILIRIDAVDVLKDSPLALPPASQQKA